MALKTKDIYEGVKNPLNDVTKGVEVLLAKFTELKAVAKETSNVLSKEIQTNTKKTTDDYRKLTDTKTKLNEVNKTGVEINKQQKLLQDQLAQSTDKQVKAKIRYTEAVKTQRKELTQLLKWQRAEKASIDKLNAANAILRKRVRGVTSATEAGRKKILAYNKVIDRNAAKVRSLSDAYTKQKINIGNYGSALKGVGSALGIMTSGAFLAAGAIRKGIDVTKQAIEVNREFEKSFANVLTLLDKAQKAKFEDILAIGSVDLMANYGLEISDVNKALFDAISAGVDAGDAIEFLNKAAVLSTGGVTDLSTAVDGVTSVMNAYQLETSEVEKVTSAFFTAQKFGKTTVEELSNSIGKVAPIAKQAGVGYQELLASLAELTKQGLSTDDATTALKSTITALIKPAEGAAKKFKELGIETGAAAIKQEGLFKTLLKVSKAAQEDSDVLAQLIPNVRALTGVGALGEEQLKDFDEILKQVNEDFGEGSSLVEAFNEQMSTGQKQADLLEGSWRRLLITIGGGESIFKRIGTSIRADLNKEITDLTKQLEIFKTTWNRIFGDLTKDEYRQALIDIENRFAGITEEIEKTNEALKGNEAITKAQMIVIMRYNSELEKNLEFTKESYEIAKKHFEIDKKKVVTISDLKDQVKGLETERKNIDINDTKRLTQLRVKIDLLKEEIKVLENLGKAPKEVKVKLDFDLTVPEITDDLDVDQGFSAQIDKEIEEIKTKLDIIDSIYDEHYDSLIGLFANYANRKAAQDKSLSAKELQTIVDSNNEKAEAYQQLADTLINIGNQILQGRLDRINTEISAKNQQINELEQSLNRELQLLQAGAANEYDTEKEKLQKLQAAREKDLAEKRKIQKQQEAINTATQISELATAVATIINSAVEDLGWAGVVAGLAAAAAAIIGFTSYKSDAESAAYGEEGGIFTKEGTHIEGGKRHSQGGNKYSSAEFEQGEMHSIFSRKASNKYGNVIEDFTNAANSGKLNTDDMEMAKYTLNALAPNSMIIINNFNELLIAVNQTNRLLISAKTPMLTSKGKLALYNYLGQMKNLEM